jgi:hypothetical protein
LRVAYDASSDPRFAIQPRRSHRGNAVGKLDFTDILHLIRPIGAKHRQMFDEYRGQDVVTALHIALDLINNVARSTRPSRLSHKW